ncbi:hypothetical protein AG2_012 [Listeria phage vB_LmoM_AG20]|uniref:Uncharacterized protein n=1 Tax=Listeria phage vB_LmoM_AG20 TaxID=1168744 RepID=M4H111_9CAUD|nr:hypothetical protein AG2_012 [Listeria phage vB_LmoM_AG20]AFJ75949.1 hypothetical protein AG2_012 [Listeria phage vB_LmoM_AG20]WIW77242.1 hypothetical protein CKA15_015 [Listeria phage cka15]
MSRAGYKIRYINQRGKMVWVKSIGFGTKALEIDTTTNKEKVKVFLDKKWALQVCKLIDGDLDVNCMIDDITYKYFIFYEAEDKKYFLKSLTVVQDKIEPEWTENEPERAVIHKYNDLDRILGLVNDRIDKEARARHDMFLL